MVVKGTKIFRSALKFRAKYIYLIRINIREVLPHGHNNLVCWIINLLLDVLLCSIADYYMARQS